MASMNTFIDTAMTIEIARQRRSSFESIARRGHRIPSTRRWWRPDRRRRGDTGPPGAVVAFPPTSLSGRVGTTTASRRPDAATTRVA
jgi:hypothetical protein